eukprot:jgi/Chlat1/9183/Chrsp97S08404
MDRFSQRFSHAGSVDFDALKSFRPLTPSVVNHLRDVYAVLAVCLLSAAAGTYVHMLLNVGGALTLVATVGTLVWLAATPPTPDYQARVRVPLLQAKRTSLLLGTAFLQGCCIGPLVEQVINIDPSIVVTAFLGTMAVFACFTGAACFAKRRSLLYLGGILSSVLGVFAMLRFASLFFGGRVMVFQAELYLGLLVFCGYVLYDTQLMIEKAHRGDRDVVMHALELFVDFIAIFVRLLIILASKEEKDKREKSRRGNTTRR